MTQKRLIQLQTAKAISGIITPRKVELFLEENESLYRDQVEELGHEYGGELVTKKELIGGLMVLLRKNILMNGGTPPPVIRPSNYPTEEFIPVCLSFNIPAINAVADKWYFVRRQRIFALGGIKRAD